MHLPAIYPIVDSYAWLAKLVPLGVQLIQLRLKPQQFCPVEIKQQIQQAQKLCAQFGTILVINDYWKLALETGCAWVHLGQEDLHSADITALKQAGIKIGISTHTLAELDLALAAQPSYIALGPIWATTSKNMPWQPQGFNRIRKWRALIGDLPLVAIGGINLDRAPSVLAAGANSVAFISDVCQHPEPEQRMRAWLQLKT